MCMFASPYIYVSQTSWNFLQDLAFLKQTQSGSHDHVIHPRDQIKLSTFFFFVDDQ